MRLRKPGLISVERDHNRTLQSGVRETALASTDESVVNGRVENRVENLFALGEITQRKLFCVSFVSRLQILHTF